jgi:peptidoglycan/LPS O-acetylase OafA/YrhL
MMRLQSHNRNRSCPDSPWYNPKNPMSHRANLDILRAFAVSFVLVHHLILTLHSHEGIGSEANRHFLVALGHAGVLAFFVHTSLVLMYSLERMGHGEHKITVPFYIRRVFRIYPLAIVTILAVVALHIPYKVWDDPKPVTGWAVVANLFLVQNIFTKQEVIGPLWSLPYEVQMYVVLPVLFFVASRRHAIFYVLTLIGVFSEIGIAIAHATGHLNMAAYVPCFLAGVLCYSLRHRVHAVVPGWLWSPFLIMLVAAFLVFNKNEEEPTFWSGWIFCLILGVAINLFRGSRAPGLNRISNKIALYSYGIYLLHVPVLYVVFVWMGVRSAASGSLLFLALTLALSIASYHAIEAPCIELGRKLTHGKLTRLDQSSTAPAP